MSARALLRSPVRCLALFALIAAAESDAVLITSGDGSGNTTAPADDFGFANVGDAVQSAVYLGGGWVITANHVAPGPVVLAGVRYEAVPDSKVRVPNEGGGVSPDLALFRLEAPWPDLPALAIRTSPPAIGAPVVLAGNGYDRGEPVTVGDRRGWKWASSTHLRWGTNRVSGIHAPFSIGPGDINSAFSMTFDERDATEHEAQVAIGDSGGGVFMKRGGTWELAGVLFAANAYEDQPAETALYGNVALAVDLSVYREAILAITRGNGAGSHSAGNTSPASCEGICGDGFALCALVPVAVWLRGSRRRQA